MMPTTPTPSSNLRFDIILILSTICLVVVSTIHHCQGFLMPARTPICHHQCTIIQNNGAGEIAGSDVILFAAKKRRRRRQDDASDTSAASDDSSVAEDRLPDFDLDSADSEKVDTTKSIASSSAISSDPNKVTSAMMGDPNMPVRSINELISDRSLESKFEFEEKSDDSIPDFIQLAQASSSSSSSSVDASGIPIGKKKQRQADRRASAMSAKEGEKEEESFLSNISFIKNENGKVSPIKILEAGGK